jgi:hypothetical protein
MIKKLFTKYFLEVVPSIVATVVGAYIVTHYINAKSDADKPKAAISTPQTLKADDSGDKAAKAESAKAEAARLKAEKLALEKAAAERAAVDRAENARKAAEKLAADKAAVEKAAAERNMAEKAASEKAAAEKRERATAKVAPVAPPSSEANAAPDDKRDANDLARAAIERLRKATPQSSEPRASEAARAEEPAKRESERAKVNSVVYAPAAVPQQPALQPLPPAVTVAPPPSEAALTAPPAPFPTPTDSSEASVNDPSRPMPPGEIPPRDIRAHERGRSVAEGVVSAARSVFQSVLPERN